MDYPKLRYINAFPIEHEGQRLICIQDPTGFCEKILFVPYHLFVLMTFFDGQHDIRDIQANYLRQYGELVYKEDILRVIHELDTHLLLESERFVAHRRCLEDEFRNLTCRPAAHAGKSYEADPVSLKNQLGSFFTSPKGPSPLAENRPSEPLKGIIAPHIDLRHGGPCFAWAYQELKTCSEAELFIIFGTDHNGARGFFTLTSKDFETPLGMVETDKAFIRELEKRYPYNLYEDELNHKTEHSVEFQVVFLQYLYQNPTRQIQIVPILCGSLHELIVTGVDPMAVPQVRDFIQALREVMALQSRKICIIAGVDLSHIGPRYGDPQGPSPSFLKHIAEEDLSMLKQVERLSLEGFFRSIAKDHNKRRVCGVAPIYALLASSDASEAKLLKYDQSLDPVTQSMVSFASMAFY